VIFNLPLADLSKVHTVFYDERVWSFGHPYWKRCIARRRQSAQIDNCLGKDNVDGMWSYWLQKSDMAAVRHAACK
jgi:hypothetical protein